MLEFSETILMNSYGNEAEGKWDNSLKKLTIYGTFISYEMFDDKRLG